jgi:hypothetical protein
MTRKQLIEEGYKYHHTASCRGYVSRTSEVAELPAVKYEGKFGEGYTVAMPRWDTTQYCYIEYWVKS